MDLKWNATTGQSNQFRSWQSRYGNRYEIRQKSRERGNREWRWVSRKMALFWATIERMATAKTWLASNNDYTGGKNPWQWHRLHTRLTSLYLINCHVVSEIGTFIKHGKKLERHYNYETATASCNSIFGHGKLLSMARNCVESQESESEDTRWVS